MKNNICPLIKGYLPQIPENSRELIDQWVARKEKEKMWPNLYKLTTTLADYKFEIKAIKGKNNIIADILTRQIEYE